MQSFAEYLAALEATAVTGSAGTPSNAEVLALLQEEYLKIHESAVFYDFMGVDPAGGHPPIYRLGSAVILQDITTQLNALVTARSCTQFSPSSGLRGRSFSVNPSLRK